MTQIKAQFLHQHKDKVVYERTILMDSLELRYTIPYGYCLYFKMPIIFDIEPPFIIRWFKRPYKVLTTCVLRFCKPDGTILYSLPENLLEAIIEENPIEQYHWSDIHWWIKVRCKMSKDKIRELAKIFSK